MGEKRRAFLQQPLGHRSNHLHAPASTRLAARMRMELSAEAAAAALPVAAPPVRAKRRFLALDRRRGLIFVTMTALLALGIFLRLYPSAGHRNLGTDEHGYMVFVKQIETVGLWNYDAVVRVYVERQYKLKEAVVPATRLAFLIPAALVAERFHLRAFDALHVVTAIAGVLLLLLCALFAYRMGGTIPMLGTTALVATAPLQIYLCQRAMIDGYFAFWAVAALWLCWENLQRPRHFGWLAAYVFCLTILVLTKENAAFVVFAIFATLLLNRFLRMGTVTPHLLAATIIGPAFAVVILIGLIGGVSEWLRFYLMFVEKSRTNFYSIVAQDGPWYRYAVDFVLVSPVIVAFACGRAFQLRRRRRSEVFLFAFLALILVAMSSVTYGMSLRYAAFCDIPLCWLACHQVLALGRRLPTLRPDLATITLFLILSAVGVNQYVRFFVRGKVYDPITPALIWAAGMEKDISNAPPGLQSFRK